MFFVSAIVLSKIDQDITQWQVTDEIIEWIFVQFTFNILQWTQTQEIITLRVSKIHKWIQGDVYEWGESFLSNNKWQIKLLSEFFSSYLSQPFMNDSTWEIITWKVLKIHEWIQEDVYGWEKFLKQWQMMDKIIEWIFFQFTFNILWMTQTQEIITHRVLKIHEWIQGDVYEWGEVS